MRALRWFCMRALLYSCIYAGFVHHIDGARRIALFLVWLGFVVICIGSCSDDAKATIFKTGRAIPQWIKITVDLIAVAALIWFGAVASGVAWFIALIVEESIWLEHKKQSEKTEKI